MKAKHGLFRLIAGLALVGLLALVPGRSLSQSSLPPRPFAGPPGWQAEGNQVDAEFGHAVDSAGDVNGDNYDDLVVTAIRYDGGGRVFVYYGSATGLPTTPSWTADGDQSSASFGVSARSAGDVNGDGYDDLIVGASGYDNGQMDEGRVYVYHGSASGLSATPNWMAESDQELALFGTRVAGAGDVNGDGFDDVIVGAHWWNGGQNQEGAVFVWYGSSSGLGPPNGTPANADWTVEGGQDLAWLGISARTAGDVNHDGYDDVVVSAPLYDNGQSNEGRALVYHGSATGLSATPNWTAEGDEANAWFGADAGAAGDVNHDGYDDLVVGASWHASSAGRVSVYYGSSGGLALTPSWTAEGYQAGAFFGTAVGTAGDVNDDGYDDLVVGANHYDNGQTDEGRVYLYLGSPSGLGPGPDWTAEIDQAGAELGHAAGTAGDVDNDGDDELVVGAHYYSGDQTTEGAALVWYGGPPPPAESLILVNEQRMATYYGDVSALMHKLYELAAHPGVTGQVLHLENDPVVAAAYAAWDANPDDAHANAVAQAIKDYVLEPALVAEPGVQYVVLVGADWLIPFYRAPENTLPPYNETWIRTDDFYADRVPTPWGGHWLYVPDLATGRLVELPAHIVGQIDTFLAGSAVMLADGAVTGYHFLTDSAQNQCGTLLAAGLAVDCSLVGEQWDRDDWLTTILNTRHDAVGLNQHANYNVLGTPTAGSNVYASEIFYGADIHDRAIFWSPGCHAGQVSSTAIDLPQAFGARRATFIGNTGYGYGCAQGACYSERLMDNLAHSLVAAATTPGQALMAAKQQYWAALPAPDAYDEKVVFESTLYGLPMYQVSARKAAAAQSGIAARVQASPIAVSAAEAQPITHTLAFTYTEVVSGSVAYYTLDGWVTDEPGEPVQPRLSYEVDGPAGPVHGILFAGGTYSTVVSFTPAVQQVLTTGAEYRASLPFQGGDDWWPTLFHTLNRLDVAEGVLERLVAIPGQYHPLRQEERLLLTADFVVLHSSLTDWQPPAFSGVLSSLAGDTVHVRAQLLGDDVDAVVAAWTESDGAWHAAWLSPAGGGWWEGAFTAGADAEFFMQAADEAGNVTLLDDGGHYFRPGEQHVRVYLPLVIRAAP